MRRPTERRDSVSVVALPPGEEETDIFLVPRGEKERTRAWDRPAEDGSRCDCNRVEATCVALPHGVDGIEGRCTGLVQPVDHNDPANCAGAQEVMHVLRCVLPALGGGMLRPALNEIARVKQEREGRK